jgi:hypothetical protein
VSWVAGEVPRDGDKEEEECGGGDFCVVFSRLFLCFVLTTLLHVLKNAVQQSVNGDVKPLKEI